MDKQDFRRELSEIATPRFGASGILEDDRNELAEAFRGCGGAFINLSGQLDEPRRTAYLLAYLLRAAAQECHRFASLAERIGADEKAREARETACAIEGLANEAESLGGCTSAMPVAG